MTVVDYLNKMFEEKKMNTGKVKNPDFEIKGILCPRKGHKDQVFITGKLRNNKITEMKYICMYCDPYMYVAAQISSEIFKGLDAKEIENVEKSKIVEITGINDSKLVEHFERVKYLILSQL